MEDIICYHGSPGGIIGDIMPVSRPHCDFGSGFYTGTNEMQAKNIVVGKSEKTEPHIYKVRFRLSELPDEKILRLEGKDWLYTVAAFRDKTGTFANTTLGKQAIACAEQSDVIIGRIADDKMNQAIQAYFKGTLTDEGVIHCLQSVKYGNQIVAKSERACDAIVILEDNLIRAKDLQQTVDYFGSERSSNENIVTEAIRKYAGHGEYYPDLIERLYKEREQEQIEEEEIER